MQLNSAVNSLLSFPATQKSAAVGKTSAIKATAAAAGTSTAGATGSATGSTAAASGQVVRGASAAGFALGVNTSTGAKLDTDTADGTEDRFLKLLVAQMRNQDPLNPMDNAQVTSQLAQISTVRGIEGLNRTMTDFVASGAQNSALSSVAMLGKQVLVPGESFAYQPPASGGATPIGFELDTAATSARIDVVDANGRVVFSNTVRNPATGLQTFQWNGRTASGGVVPAGRLSVQVLALDGNVPVDSTVLVPARVVGISQTSAGARLELDGVAPVAPGDVRQIL